MPETLTLVRMFNFIPNFGQVGAAEAEANTARQGDVRFRSNLMSDATARPFVQGGVFESRRGTGRSIE